MKKYGYDLNLRIKITIFVLILEHYEQNRYFE